MYDMFLLLISAMFAGNVVLSQFLGICPFLGVSKNIQAAFGMGTAVMVVIVIANAVTYPVGRFLSFFGIEFMQTLFYILIIATLVQVLEIIIKSKMKKLYDALGVYLPLITTNCAVLGTAIKSTDAGYGFFECIVYGLGVSLGFLIAIVIMAGLRMKINYNRRIPKAFQGTPITLITAGLMSIAFYGFSGL